MVVQWFIVLLSKTHAGEQHHSHALTWPTRRFRFSQVNRVVPLSFSRCPIPSLPRLLCFWPVRCLRRNLVRKHQAGTPAPTGTGDPPRCSEPRGAKSARGHFSVALVMVITY